MGGPLPLGAWFGNYTTKKPFHGRVVITNKVGDEDPFTT